MTRTTETAHRRGLRTGAIAAGALLALGIAPLSSLEAAAKKKSPGTVCTKTVKGKKVKVPCKAPAPKLVAGPQGARGAQGPAGANGATGADGTTGSTGSTGNQGARGTKIHTDAGTVAQQGSDYSLQRNNGDEGAGDLYLDPSSGALFKWVGANNWQYLLRIVGPKGDKGDTGAKGDQGERGLRGNKIFRGDVQPADADVMDGDQWIRPKAAPAHGVEMVRYDGDLKEWVSPADLNGPQGIQGIQGIQGAKGDQGNKGDKGDQGIQGPQGNQGLKGDKGDQGIQGLKGDKGDQGIQGVQGDRGASIATGKVAPSSALAGDLFLDTDTMALSKFQSGAWAPVGSVKGDVGPQGEAGPTGAAGPQGPAGPAGAAGATGPQGPMGPAGFNTGTAAPTSSTGSTGSMYYDSSKDLLYGPKQSDGTWGTPRQLKGQGAAKLTSTALSLNTALQSVTFSSPTQIVVGAAGSTLQVNGAVTVSAKNASVVTCQPKLTSAASTAPTSAAVFASKFTGTLASGTTTGSIPLTASWVLSGADTYTVGVECQSTSASGDSVASAQVNAVNVSS